MFDTQKVSEVFQNAEELYKRHTNEYVVYYQKVDVSDSSNSIFIGDLHSCIFSLCKILKWCDDKKWFENDTFKLKAHHYIFMLGDLVDRGPFGIDILVIAFMMKRANPDQFFICNGNHENAMQYNKETNGLATEWRKEYDSSENWIYIPLLALLPSAIMLRRRGRWHFLCHGAPDYRLLTYCQNWKKHAKPNIETSVAGLPAGMIRRAKTTNHTK